MREVVLPGTAFPHASTADVWADTTAGLYQRSHAPVGNQGVVVPGGVAPPFPSGAGAWVSGASCGGAS